MAGGSKQWWKTSAEILGAPSKICSIPVLKDGAGNWLKDAEPKANLLAKTFSGKYNLPDEEQNEYSNILPTGHVQDSLFFPAVDAAYKQLLALRPGLGTGPDDAPSLILRTCARELAIPIAMLTVRILACMEWPAV